MLLVIAFTALQLFSHSKSRVGINVVFWEFFQYTPKHTHTHIRTSTHTHMHTRTPECTRARVRTHTHTAEWLSRQTPGQWASPCICMAVDGCWVISVGRVGHYLFTGEHSLTAQQSPLSRKVPGSNSKHHYFDNLCLTTFWRTCFLRSWIKSPNKAITGLLQWSEITTCHKMPSIETRYLYALCFDWAFPRNNMMLCVWNKAFGQWKEACCFWNMLLDCSRGASDAYPLKGKNGFVMVPWDCLFFAQE